MNNSNVKERMYLDKIIINNINIKSAVNAIL